MGKCECGRLKGNPCGPLRPNTINVTMPHEEWLTGRQYLNLAGWKKQVEQSFPTGLKEITEKQLLNPRKSPTELTVRLSRFVRSVTDWLREILIWSCEGFWEKKRLFRPRPCRGSRRSGTASWRSGRAHPWMSWQWFMSQGVLPSVRLSVQRRYGSVPGSLGTKPTLRCRDLHNRNS